jgi:hypothetical protein
VTSTYTVDKLPSDVIKGNATNQMDVASKAIPGVDGGAPTPATFDPATTNNTDAVTISTGQSVGCSSAGAGGWLTVVAALTLLVAFGVNRRKLP